jgi:hypothetical protein
VLLPTGTSLNRGAPAFDSVAPLLRCHNRTAQIRLFKAYPFDPGVGKIRKRKIRISEVRVQQD